LFEIEQETAIVEEVLDLCSSLYNSLSKEQQIFERLNPLMEFDLM